MRKYWTALAAMGLFLALHIYLKVKAPPSLGQTVQLGAVLQATTGKTLAHLNVDLGDIARSHVLTVINFFESWCGPCKIELPDLEAMYTTYAKRGLALVGVYRASSPADVKELIDHYHLDYPILADENGSLTQQCNVEVVPTTVVVDANLRVVRSTRGIDEALRGFLERNLPQATP